MSHPKFTAMAFAATLGLSAALLPALSPANAQDSGLEPQRQGSVTWISGGIGQDELEALHAAQSGYNLRLLFALQGSGEYLANVAVRVVNGHGDTLLDANSRGPFLYAKLPAGTYKVTASSEGRAQTRSISVPATGAAAQSFYWPAS